MATDSSTPTGPASETEDQEANQQGQQKTTPESGGNGSQQASVTAETQLPDDHPLVTAYKRAKTENQSLKDAKAEADKVPALQQERDQFKADAEKLAPLQAQYGRLEAFLTALGGPVAKILDSRTYTDRLFKSEDKIEDIIRDWHKDNPSATSTALGSTGADSAPGKVDPNVLLRAAVGK